MKSSSWRSRAFAFILSPTILVGGILGSLATKGFEYFQENIQYNRSYLTELRKDLASDLPTQLVNLEDVQSALRIVQRYFIIHTDKPAQNYLSNLTQDLIQLEATFLAAEKAKEEALAAKQLEAKTTQQANELKAAEIKAQKELTRAASEAKAWAQQFSFDQRPK